MELQQCALCQHWKKQRPQDNWGDCQLIQPDTGEGPVSAQAVITTCVNTINDAMLRTRDVFSCAMFEQREVRKVTTTG